MRVRIVLLGVLVTLVGVAVAVPLVAAFRPDDQATWVRRPGLSQAPHALPEGAIEPARAQRAMLRAPERPESIRVRNATLFGWALLDHRTGAFSGSPNSATVTNTVESMIKPWIVADYLRRHTETGRTPTPAALEELRLIIVDSHDPLTEKYYRLGGADAVIERLASVCGLTRVGIKPTLWSWTTMTPRDAARYGACVADSRAAGPQWTGWLLDAMRAVRGELTGVAEGAIQGGRWGIIDGLPPELARETAMKNGWTLYVDGWHVNCLAVHPEWTLVVMLRTGALRAAADSCESVTTALVVDGS